jgi:hypothetical protein
VEAVTQNAGEEGETEAKHSGTDRIHSGFAIEATSMSCLFWKMFSIPIVLKMALLERNTKETDGI